MLRIARRLAEMKICPYCKEEIHSEALKCRFCGSSLLPLPIADARPADDDRATYIVDRDLVRFAKFASAVLAVFLVVGAYFFGFKLEATVEKVRSTQEELKSLQEKLTFAQRDLLAAQATVKGLKKEVETVLNEAKTSLGDISAQKEAAIALVVSMRDLSPREAAVLTQLKSAQSDKTRSGSPNSYWANGATIRVRFLDGNATDKAQVVSAAKEWMKYANLKFIFVDDGDSEIRVSFKEQGSWSYLGTQALAVARNAPTINYQWINQRALLHEFGHALGLIEEHMNPRAKIAWDKEAVYRFASGPPNNWPKDMIEKNIFHQFPASLLGTYREFDPDSIMTLHIPPNLTGGVVMGLGEGLSPSDKALVARIYPQTR